MRALALAALLLVGCGGTPDATPSLAFKLATLNAGDADRPDTVTDRAVAEVEFARVLDCIVDSFDDTTHERASDTMFVGWQQSGKVDTLLEWAQAFC